MPKAPAAAGTAYDVCVFFKDKWGTGKPPAAADRLNIYLGADYPGLGSEDGPHGVMDGLLSLPRQSLHPAVGAGRRGFDR